MTTNNVPTDDEIIALAQETKSADPGRDGYILPVSFARAVLERFGQPAMTADEWLKQHEALMHRATKAALVAGYSGRGEAALDKAEYALLDHARRRIEGKT